MNEIEKASQQASRAEQRAPLEIARDAIQANHQWHKDYDDHDGYEDSEIEATNLGALACINAALRDFDATHPAPASASEPAKGEPAPPHSLPDWDECALRVHNSDFIAKRVAEGGYDAEPDSKLASQLHRFIYEYDDADPYRSAWFMHRFELLVNEIRSESASASVAGAGEALSDDLVQRLRNTPNWRRESYGSWKDCVTEYDRAPFEAADAIERLTKERDTAVSAHEAAVRAGFSFRERVIELSGHRARLIEALAELVALKDMKDRFASTDYSAADPESFDAARAEYARRKPLAWASARAALAVRPVADGEAELKLALKRLTEETTYASAFTSEFQVIPAYVVDEVVKQLIAALAHQAPAPLSQSVPEGFWLAPMEPDEDLCEAVADVKRCRLLRAIEADDLDELEPRGMAAACGDEFRAARDSWLSRHPQPQAVTEDARDGERKS